ncbi:hypothetical protein GURASL_18480 [Geotalea uraniireducens]|uniref:histidine kinase n=1 Tax=Geotalea uraniireducens TaxID=351604 RepID=A0ABM8EK96_9BACT|nr:PAS domain S-box protein [Geotalea uraniireducens]BDV42925.1 hypothetical protein GURASL_18480 [Geotalea uraniireducens]
MNRRYRESKELEDLSQALQASETRFRNVVTASADGMIIVDEHGIIMLVNPAASALFNRATEELLGESFGFPIVAGETTELDIVRSGRPACVEVQVTETAWEGRPARLLVLRDITERRHAEQELRKMYRAVLESPSMVIITDPHGAIEFVNPRFCEVTGYSLTDIAGKKPLCLRSDVVGAEVFEGMMAAIRARSVWRGELACPRKNGEIYWQSLAISPVRDTEGNVVNFIAVGNETTEQKRAAEQILRLNTELEARAAELEAANRELEAFNYTVAHDLRGPLNVISSYCQVIRDLCGTKLDDTCNEYLAEAYNGTLRMSQLIDALIRFSLMSHVELHREVIDLSALAQEIAVEQQIMHPERHCSFRIAGGVTAFGDRNLLRTVLANLLGNAWKYTGERDNGVIEFGTAERDGTTVYFVRDNGSGFVEEEAGKLFVPFQRLHGPEQFKGFGVGLATVERIVLRHGGKVWAEGKPGKGATFWFTLAHDGASP